MSLGEGASCRIAYKAYSTGAIQSNVQPDSSINPGATDGQILRRTSSTLSLTKDTYQSAEVRADRQIGDYRHGVKRVTGSLNGELSPGTYWDFVEAVLRGTETAAVAKSNTEFTSVAADNATSKFTFGGGDPVTEGYRVGMVIRFTNLSEALNNAKNFLITGFSGASNRDVSVHPAPATMSADTAFNVTSVGKRVITPASAHVSRKFAIEHYFADINVRELFTECRVGGMNFNLPATGMATVEIPMMGRDMEPGSGPFFTAPADVMGTGILAAVNGLIRVQGVNQGVITGAQVNINLSPESPAVVGQNFVPEIFLGRTQVSGQITAFFEDLTLVNYFRNETEISVLLYLLASSADAGGCHDDLPAQVKLGNAQAGIEGEGGVPLTMPFQALRYLGSAAGIDQTTIAFCDTAAS